MESGAIFPLLYLPPIEFFKELLNFKNDTILIDKNEHFPKQTYRNRASIYGANGALSITVPVVKGAKLHTCVKDVKISYDANWQRIHWMSLQASYRSSAYFEFYEDAFAPFYHHRYNFLFDYNLELLQTILKLLKLDVTYSFTESYQAEYPQLKDFRSSIHPKISSDYQPKKYYQVFEDKYNFIPNLSIVDLLFNQGPQAVKYL
ncbi:WbqC family protein [Pedobacter puniceum]|jgi:hypothetical protein|uniref:WbqC family protein n=1 Tax=Pedobacter puniceum TaxID=2666136 RepID=A0A7K0FKL1_9SPHI|nr:WbqC family protein [Pedobacter puniceum]MRX46478.1 hypothetical protein [Pedobacter puniceum]